MPTTWLTADWHLGHANIIRLCDRPFDSLHAMHHAIMARWNERVGADDTVWILGDVAWDPRLIQPFLAGLSGHKTLVAGNHDRCHPCHARHDRWLRRYQTYGFDAAHPTIAHVDGVTLCHLPVTGESDVRPDRYAPWRPPPDTRGVVACGHVHNRWLARGSVVNVGVDVWGFAPVALDDVLAIATLNA